MWRINSSSSFVGVELVYFGRRQETPNVSLLAAATLSFHIIKKLNDIKISRAHIQKCILYANINILFASFEFTAESRERQLHV